MEWCREKVICLIRLFEERPCLWDKTHKFYRDRDAKNAAMLEISEQLNLSCIEVERKLNTLLTQYRREKHVQRKMESAGCLVKKPWFGYNLLKFLENADNKYFNKWTLNKSENLPNTDIESLQRVLFNTEGINTVLQQPSQDEESLPNATEPEIVVEQSAPETFPRPIRERERGQKRRRHSPDRTSIRINQAYRILRTAFKQSQQRDDLKIFAEGVESRLRNIKDRKKVCILKHQIETLLFTAEMEELAHASMSAAAFGLDGQSVICKSNIAPKTDENSKAS